MLILTSDVCNAKARYEMKFGHHITLNEIPSGMTEDEFCEEIDQAIASGIPICRYVNNAEKKVRRKGKKL